MSRDRLVVAAALSAAFAIMAGAFGAHAATGQSVEWLRTGALYQMVHAVAAISTGERNRRAAWLMLAGAAVFAFSVYAIALGTPHWFGAVTPLGGVTMIAAWLWLAFGRPR